MDCTAGLNVIQSPVSSEIYTKIQLYRPISWGGGGNKRMFHVIDEESSLDMPGFIQIPRGLGNITTNIEIQEAALYCGKSLICEAQSC